MNEADVITLLREAVWVTLKLSSPMLIIGMSIGLFVSIIQTTTSIQEQTLTFVPKLVGILVGLVMFASWLIQTLIDYTTNIFEAIGRL